MGEVGKAGKVGEVGEVDEVGMVGVVGYVEEVVWRGCVRCGIKFIVFYLLLLTIFLLRYFYYTLVRLSL